MKTSILKASVAAAVVLCSTVLVAKEPRIGSGNAGGGKSNVQGKGPDQSRTDGRGKTDAHSNIDTRGKENPPSSQGKAGGLKSQMQSRL